MNGEPVRLGMLRLADAAPLVWAQVQGLFAAEGVAVQLQVEPSWANVADKLAWALLDGAVMSPPLALAMHLGLRTPGASLAIVAGISLEGNTIVLSRSLAAAVLRDGRPAPAEAARRLRAALTRPPRLAVVHAWSTHDLLLRDWLASGGIDPDAAELVVIPPAEMVAALAGGAVDGFCAGPPWGGAAEQAGAGAVIATSAELWPGHPEKCLALRAGWAAQHPGRVRALLLAAQACADAANAAAVASVLARPEWVGVSAGLLAAALPGGGGPCCSVFDPRRTSLPDSRQAAGWVRQMRRWRQLPDDAEELARAAYRPEWLRAETLPQS